MKLMTIATSLCTGAALTIAMAAPLVAAEEEATAFDLDAAVADFVGLAPGGAVALTVRDGMTEASAFGIADASGRPLDIDTPFRVQTGIGPLLGAMFMLLVDEGKLDLGAPLSAYLPGAPYAGDATIGSLLAMTAGIPDTSDIAMERSLADPSHAWTDDELLALVDPDTILPGTLTPGMAPYHLAGLAAGQLDGVDLRTVFTNRIVEPFGLESTTYLGAGEPEPDGLAAGWMFEFGYQGDPEVETTAFDTYGAPTSSATDMATFMTALLDGQVVSEDSLALMFAEHETLKWNPGLVQLQSWYQGGDYRAGWFGTFGFHPLGYTATVAANPETKDIVIVMTNNAELGAWVLESQILEAWANEG